MVKLYINNTTTYVFEHKKLFKKIITNIILNEKIQQKTEANLIILNNYKIKKISHKYRNINKATDILSFPSDYKKLFPIIKYNMLGDIYISYEKILLQSKKFNHSIKREWSYIFSHGLLHLLGYEHNTKINEKIMHNKIEKVLNKLGVTRNA